MADIERRQLNEGLELRAKEGGGKTLTGYAAVFDSLSEDLGGFREIIKPGAFDRALKDKHDVRALVNHDNSLLLGRTASGTLRLSTDERGLKYEIDMLDTTAARVSTKMAAPGLRITRAPSGPPMSHTPETIPPTPGVSASKAVNPA